MPANGPEPLLLSVKEAMATLGIGRTKFYELAGEGRFDLVRIAGRTMVRYASLKTYVDGLPAWRPRRDQRGA